MDSYRITPNTLIQDCGSISRAFMHKGICHFHDACEYVLGLPYGRTSDKSEWALVLVEGRGTCSTKHALIAALARELNMDIQLMLGIYPMKESNTPGVGEILDKSEFDFLPEAHCYLKYKDHVIDLTGVSGTDAEPINEFFIEEQIVPEQIGTYKEDFHKKYLKQWEEESKFEEIWSLREACIHALASKNESK